jgi:hypothetical protein
MCKALQDFAASGACLKTIKITESQKCKTQKDTGFQLSLE